LETVIIEVLRKYVLAEVNRMTKKPFYKRWRVYVYTFAAIVLFGWIIDFNDGTDANDVEVAAETEVEAKVEAKVPVVAVKTPEEIAAEAEVVAAKKKADEEKAAEAAKVKAESDAEAKVAAVAKKARAAEKEATVAEDFETEIMLIRAATEGVVVAIEKSPYGVDSWTQTWVTVSDAWYDSEPHVKERFADTIGAQVKASLYATGAVKEGDSILVHFYDTHAKELAKEKIFGGYDIKR